VFANTPSSVSFPTRSAPFSTALFPRCSLSNKRSPAHGVCSPNCSAGVFIAAPIRANYSTAARSSVTPVFQPGGHLSRSDWASQTANALKGNWHPGCESITGPKSEKMTPGKALYGTDSEFQMVAKCLECAGSGKLMEGERCRFCTGLGTVRIVVVKE